MSNIEVDSKDLKVSILTQFLNEYNELYYKNLNKGASKDSNEAFEDIRQVEKIMSNPKFHPTSELKAFYKNLRESYSKSFNLALVGSNALSKIIFINVLVKDSIIPLNNALAQKKIIIKYTPGNTFTRAYYYKSEMTPINLHALELTQNILDEIEYLEVYCNAEILKNIDIVTQQDSKNLNNIKNSDIVIWIYELKSKINNQDILNKIFKKKQNITILTYTNKTYEENELLEQISSDTKNLDKNFNLNDIYDIDLWNLFYGYRLDEKFVFYKTFGLLNKQATLSKTKSLENALTSLRNAKSSIESFYIQKEDSKDIQAQLDKIQSDKILKISELIESKLKFAKIKRSKSLIKDALKEQKIIDSAYKTLFQHYKNLDTLYHKANLKLVSKFIQINDQFNKEASSVIAKSLKKYLDSIVDSILDNIEVIKVRTRPARPSFLDNLTNRLIVYSSFQVNNDEILKEMEDSQSFLARKHKSLLTRIEHFNIYMEQSITDALNEFGNVIKEWIGKGHHLVLQKKPSIISMDRYFSLEEFNLNVYSTFSKKHFETLNEYIENIRTRLLTLSIWVNLSKKIMLDCVTQKLQVKFQNDKNLAKERKLDLIKPVDRDFIIDSIIDILPSKIQEFFCTLPRKQFNSIAMILTNEGKDNERIIRYRAREIMDLRQSMKVATKLLEGLEK